MNGENFKTPLNKARYGSTSTKRDSLAAELERDPQLSTAKRQQRTQVFNSTISHANLERQLLAAQTANSEFETKLREKELQVERLERDRRWFADREKEEREEKERERIAYDEAKRKADTEVRTLRSSLTALREEHADLHDTHSALSRNTTQTLTSQKSLLTTLNHRIALLEDELSQARQTADERSRTLSNLQLDYDELAGQQDALVQSVAEHETMGIVREELQRQAGYLRALEATNAKMSAELNGLRERHGSLEVLREEKRGLETKLAVLGGLRERVVRLEAELDAARMEREEWATKTNEAAETPSKTPIAVTRNLAELRLAHARLLEEHGATTAALKRREAEIANFEKREAELLEAIQDLENQLRRSKEETRRTQSRTSLAEREVGYLEALLSSFKAEEAYADMPPPPSVDATKIQRVEELESLLVEYKTLNDHLRDQVESSVPSNSLRISSEELEIVEKEKTSLKNTLEEQEKEIQVHLGKIDELEQTLFELGGEIAGGRHVPPNTRILCMKENPDQEWVDLRQATMDRLKNENEALLNRLKELEGLLSATTTSTTNTNTTNNTTNTNTNNANTNTTLVTPHSKDQLVPRESYDQVHREKLDLQNEVKQKEKRLLRLQQVFTSKSAEFREAMASILGLKMAFYPNGQVRVTSVFDLNASFVFQPVASKANLKGGAKGGAKEGAKGGEKGEQGGARMQLVAQGEGGPQDLPNLMQYWIETEQCTPGFLASVTLECYDNWKRGGGGGGGAAV